MFYGVWLGYFSHFHDKFYLCSSVDFLILVFLEFPVSLINSVPSRPLGQVNKGMVKIVVISRCSEEGRKKFGCCSKVKRSLTTLITT